MASKAYPHGRRGFAAMSVEKQRAIARLGGKAAHAQGKAHEWDSHAAREAGRKGGAAPRRARRPLADFEFTMTVRGVTTITLDHLTRLLIRETEFGERVHRRGALALRRAYRESLEKLNADDWCGKETADEEDDEHGTTL